MRDSNPRPPRCKRDALPAELIARPRRHPARRAPSGRAGRRQFNESRNPLPGLNLACFDAAILIFSPVRGFRPSEAAREATEKVPKPTSRTSAPPFSASAIASNTASTALLASVFLSSVLPATASTSSFLFTGSPPARVCWIDAAYSPMSLERGARRVNYPAGKESKPFGTLQAVPDTSSQSASEAPCKGNVINALGALNALRWRQGSPVPFRRLRTTPLGSTAPPAPGPVTRRPCRPEGSSIPALRCRGSPPDPSRSPSGSELFSGRREAPREASP